MPRRPGLPLGPPAPPSLPALHLAHDHPPAVVAAHVRSGRWTRVRRGAYVESLPPGTDRYTTSRAAGLAHVAAVTEQLHAGQVLSHASAALLWGLPVPTRPAAVHVIHTTNPNAALPRDVVRHVAALAPEDVAVRADRLVTTLERTAVDCAATLGPSGGLAVLDAALHHGADQERIAELVARRVGSRGVRVARALLAVADDGAESPGETLARLALLRLGVTPPVTQVAVATGRGTYWADLGWPQWGVVGEYDGVAKYTAQGDAADAVLREKRRQEAIEEAGTAVLRLVAEDCRNPDALLRRLRRMLPATAFGQPVDPYLR